MRSRNQYHIFICGSLFYFVFLQRNTVNKSISYQLVSGFLIAYRNKTPSPVAERVPFYPQIKSCIAYLRPCTWPSSQKASFGSPNGPIRNAITSKIRPFCGEYVTRTATPSGTDLSRAVGNCRESVLWVRVRCSRPFAYQIPLQWVLGFSSILLWGPLSACQYRKRAAVFPAALI